MNQDSIGVALDGATGGSDGAHTFLVDLSYKHDAPDGAKKSPPVWVSRNECLYLTCLHEQGNSQLIPFV